MLGPGAAVFFFCPDIKGGFRVDHYAAQFREFKPKSSFHLLGHVDGLRQLKYPAWISEVKREVHAAAHFMQFNLMASTAPFQSPSNRLNPLNVCVRLYRIQRHTGNGFIAARFYVHINIGNGSGHVFAGQFARAA